MIRIFVLLSAIVLALAACQGQSVESIGEKVNVGGGAYTDLNSGELNTMLKNKDFVFVNVHIPFEGDIANTDLSIPYDQITEPSYLSQLPADKNAKIVLYCRSGRMSTIAAEVLVKQGYTNIWNLKDGMLDWEQSGYPLEK